MVFNTAMLLSEWYDHAIEWILRHIILVYAIEIMLILALSIYGMVSEHGFRTHRW